MVYRFHWRGQNPWGGWPAAVEDAGRYGTLSRRNNQVDLRRSLAYRLAAAAEGAEDTEKAAVFLYSKVKEQAARQPRHRDMLGIMLHYNVTFTDQGQPAASGACWAPNPPRKRKWEA
jgi:hypothetical protein